MSVFELNRFSYDLQDDAARRAFQDDEAAFLAGYDLTPPERALIDARDWSGLADAGVSTYILGNFGRAVGVSFPEIGAAMRGETPAEMAAFIERQNERVAAFAIAPGEDGDG